MGLLATAVNDARSHTIYEKSMDNFIKSPMLFDLLAYFLLFAVLTPNPAFITDSITATIIADTKLI